MVCRKVGFVNTANVVFFDRKRTGTRTGTRNGPSAWHGSEQSVPLRLCPALSGGCYFTVIVSSVVRPATAPERKLHCVRPAFDPVSTK